MVTLVKPLTGTHWESRIDALQYNIEEVYAVMYKATTDPKVDAFFWGGGATACNIAKKPKDFMFLCSLVSWYDTLFRVYLVRKEKNFRVKMSWPLWRTSSFLESTRSENGISAITRKKELT
ncbi:hypothetical protein AVEN_213644-1 [Araneus ventricosus]|uniref:Uncharacterized protein n=1 Tax=Araneus ventricosus TaxID=182803 RepID=A0A4Y2P791_ARAVE|nr:hypothetical protein AVEN_213644-1 [Araneus ventricosus]